MTNQKKEVLTRDDIVNQLNSDTACRGFVEFPKCLYHPDGRVMQVNDKAEEQSHLSADWTPSPAEAIKAKARRDERDRTAVAQAVAPAASNGRK